MRIVLVNWARIRDGAASGGGVNGYCQAIALELAGRGHEVISLCGGTSFEPGPAGGDLPGDCFIRRLDDWKQIRIYEVVNSPILAPSIAQFRDPAGEISAPVLERKIEGLIAELAPDIVHFHNIEGFSAGCIAAVRRGAPAARVFYSLHNYHTLCPQVYLMQGHRRPCHGYENGNACRTCIPTVDPQHERVRAIAKFQGREISPVWSEWGVPADAPAANPASKPGLLRRLRRASAPPPPAAPPEEQPWTEAWITRPARRILLNIIEPEPASGLPPTLWAHRRAAMVRMLSECDRVLAVSDFVRAKFEAMGVARGKLHTLHIGSRMTDLAAEFGRRLPDTRRDESQRNDTTPVPIRICFMGYHNWYKGLPMLVESLNLLSPEVLRRLHLVVYALGGEQMEPELRALEPRLAALTLRHGYRYEEIPALLAQIDLGLVTSVWWDNAPQTVMEFHACGIPVLGAALGGIPDFIREGENGLLFRGNDRWDLARRLAEVVKSPDTLARLRRGVKPPKTIAEHAAELEHLYALPLS